LCRGKVTYTAPLPDFSHIRLSSLKLFPAFIFFKKKAKWEEKDEHGLETSQLITETVLNLLRDKPQREYAYSRSQVPSVHTLSSVRIKTIIQKLVQPINRTKFIHCLKHFATFSLSENYKASATNFKIFYTWDGFLLCSHLWQSSMRVRIFLIYIIRVLALDLSRFS
jgi:hypothetical protein